MNNQQILAQVRLLLMAAGSVLVTKGVVNNDELTDIVGAVVGLIPVVWAHVAHAGNPPPPAGGAKGILTPLLIGSLLACGAMAQTVTNESGGTTTVTNAVTLPTQAENFTIQGYNILKTLSWTNGFTESTLGLYVPSTKAYGAIISVNTAGTNGINYGFFFGGLQNKSTGGFDLYDGGIAVSLNGHENIPIIGEVELTVETGAVLDLAHPSAGAFNQDLANFYKELYQTSDGNLTIGANVGIGWSNVPQVDGKFYTAGITITDLFKGKHFLGLF